MDGRGARRKGHDFERETARRFAEVFGSTEVRRGLQYRDGADCADVIAPALWIECKRGRKTNARAALAQATAASEGKGYWPIAVCKDDNEPATVTISLDDFLDLVREWWELRRR